MTPGSVLLVVDASLQGVSFAVVDPARPPKDRVVWAKSHAENMGAVAAIARLGGEALAAAGIAPKQLAGLAVATGPGSFTGIKVGLAFAYGLAAGIPKLPMLGLSALECAASNLASDGFGGVFALFLPATRTHGYWTVAGEVSRPAALIEVGPNLAEAMATLPPGARLEVFGRWPSLTDLVKESGRSITERAPWEVCRAAVYGMAEKAADAWPGGYAATLPPPRYLRLSTAEEHLAKTSGVKA
jgi:tRNA threonylcarbamoyladenosine biosynthesis protein TsaB